MLNYIPSDLLSNILARLPLDNVLRCTTVCKLWYSHITSPSFASVHLNLSNPEPRLLVRYTKTSKSNCFRLDNRTYNQIETFRLLSLPVYQDWWETIYSLNGLVCLYDAHEHTIVLWNPSIRKSLLLPKSRVLLDSRITYQRSVGFGYVDTSNDYKIVKYSYAYNGTKPQAEIYQLSTNSWHHVKLEESFAVRVKYRQAHLNGILHWCAYDTGKANPFSNFICTFDLKHEKYGTLVVPSCLRLRRHDHDTYFKPSTYRGLLSLIDYKSQSSCKIWVMKEYGVAESWQNLIVINTKLHRLEKALHSGHNGEILFEKKHCRIPGCRELRRYDSCVCHELVSYDCSNGQFNSCGLHTKGVVVNCIHTYVESLAIVKHPYEVKFKEHTS